MGFYTRTKKDQKDWSFCPKRLRTSPSKKGRTVAALVEMHPRTTDTRCGMTETHRINNVIDYMGEDARDGILCPPTPNMN